MLFRKNKTKCDKPTQSKRKVTVWVYVFFFFFHLENPVIAVFSNKAQEVDAPGVHQLIVGGACHSAGCLRNTRNHTLAIHLLARSEGKYVLMLGLTRLQTKSLWNVCWLAHRSDSKHIAVSQGHCTWWVTKECSLTSALSLTSFHTSSPYDSLMKSWRLSHSSPYIVPLWIETQAEHSRSSRSDWLPALFPKAPASR